MRWLRPGGCAGAPDAGSARAQRTGCYHPGISAVAARDVFPKPER